MIDVDVLQKQLCNAFCASVSINKKGSGAVISLPLHDRDGDSFTVYVSGHAGGFQLSDVGNTLMRLSYEHDVDKLLSGSRGKLFELAVAEAGATSNDGELLLNAAADNMIPALFSFGQMMSRVSDLSLWSKQRAASTFHDDLKQLLHARLPEVEIQEDYLVPNLQGASHYPIDFFINAHRPLYIFSAHNKDKARLVTIILQHLKMSHEKFDSLVVCANAEDLPKQDLLRLMSAANDVAPDFGEHDVIVDKIRHRLA